MKDFFIKLIKPRAAGISTLIMSMILSTLPTLAQEQLPLQYEYQFKGPAKFDKPTVFLLGSKNQLLPLKMNAMGRLYESQAPVASVTTGATVVGLALPAYSLTTTGKAIHVRLFGTTAANANTKVINFMWGGTTVVLQNAASNAKDFYADIMVYRTGTNAQQICVAGYANAALLNGLGTTSAQSESAAINCQVQVPASTTAGDVTITEMVIEGEPG